MCVQTQNANSQCTWDDRGQKCDVNYVDGSVCPGARCTNTQGTEYWCVVPADFDLDSIRNAPLTSDAEHYNAPYEWLKKYGVPWACQRLPSDHPEYCEYDPLLHGGGDRRLAEAADAEPYSRFPGNAEADADLANARQVIVADFDGDERMDLFLHAPAPSAGSCAQRCHGLGRFGREDLEIRHTNDDGHDESEPTYCYCGPQYVRGGTPPPSPPVPPPSPSTPPGPPPSPRP